MSAQQAIVEEMLRQAQDSASTGSSLETELMTGETVRVARNEASALLLVTLSGVEPVTSDAIVENRLRRHRRM